MIGYANVNFLLIFHSLKSQSKLWWFLSPYNGQFLEKIWGIRCKFFVNFHREFFPFTIQRTFFRKFRGGKCKFSVNSRLQINHNNQVPYTPPHPKRTNFHRMTICRFVNFLWMKICPSYYNVHFFFKTQVSDQKIFCFHTKRTIFRQMVTP